MIVEILFLVGMCTVVGVGIAILDSVMSVAFQ